MYTMKDISNRRKNYEKFEWKVLQRPLKIEFNEQFTMSFRQMTDTNYRRYTVQVSMRVVTSIFQPAGKLFIIISSTLYEYIFSPHLKLWLRRFKRLLIERMVDFPLLIKMYL